MSKKFRGNLLLLLTAIIWGSAFVAQKQGMDFVKPFTFNAVRNFIATLVLMAVIPFFSSPKTERFREDKKTLLIGGIWCGIVLFIAGALQQIGVQYTTSGKAGFITTLYIVIVPILALFLGKKVDKKIWFCILVAGVGFYLLSIKDDFSIGKGDLLVFLCAIFFSVHILVIDYFSPRVDGVKMSCIQFFVCGLISMVAMFLFESPNIDGILKATIPILYTAVLSSGVGYTLQIVAQKDTDPTIASLILSLESVFSVLAGLILLKEVPTIKETVGCVFIFFAIIFAQLPSKNQKKIS